MGVRSAFGTVWSARDKSSGEVVAVKVLELEDTVLMSVTARAPSLMRDRLMSLRTWIER
jgi:hypothetical protein